MNRKELLRYAIQGINVEIADIENKIDKGYSVIDKINRNVAPTTAKSKEEITEKIKEYQQKRAESIKKRDRLLFDDLMAETDEATERREEHLIKIALSSILSDNVRHLGNLTLEDISKLLDKIALRPYCERIGKRYDELTEDDKQIIADMQLDDYIKTREQYINEVEEGRDEQ